MKNTSRNIRCQAVSSGEDWKSCEVHCCRGSSCVNDRPLEFDMSLLLAFSPFIAFGALVLADILMAYVPAVPHSTGVIATVVALVAAMKFTSWYPEQRAARQT